MMRFIFIYPTTKGFVKEGPSGAVGVLPRSIIASCWIFQANDDDITFIARSRIRVQTMCFLHNLTYRSRFAGTAIQTAIVTIVDFASQEMPDLYVAG